jgi:predicted nucleotidyltransferase
MSKQRHESYNIKASTAKQHHLNNIKQKFQCDEIIVTMSKHYLQIILTKAQHQRKKFKTTSSMQLRQGKNSH